jgi:site-specific DNA-methyltransferase (adenine-specific)
MSAEPFYDDGQVTLYCADMRQVGLDGQAACVVTSPPYNVGIAYDGYSDSRGWDEYRALVAEAASAIARALVPAGRAWVNTAVSVPQRPGGRGRKRRVLLGLLWAQVLDTAGLELVDQVAWQSVRAGGTAWGSWQSPAAPNLRGDYEVLTVACRGRWERRPPQGAESWRDTIGHWPELCSTVWPIQTVGGRIPPGSNTPGDSVTHPAPMPIEVARRCIRLSTWPGELVLDPFAGTGTTLVAARDLGRRAIGIEVAERYCELAVQRLAQGALDFKGAA